MDLSQFETRDRIDESMIRIYSYGSRVYGCHTEESDHDFIVIVKYDGELDYNVDSSVLNSNFKVFSEQTFIKKIKDHHISALECIFQDENDPYLKYFDLDKAKLRRSISGTASNSFVKAKKKMKQGDYYIGKKSLFHSLRILGFGIQIAEKGKIVDYSAHNEYYKIIMGMTTNEWADHEEIFKEIYNHKKSQFRILAPLDDEV